MKRMYSIPSCILLILWLLFVVDGCGGSGGGSSGGGGGSAPMSYSGPTSQAAINATNAEDLTTGALLGSTVGISVLTSAEADKNVALSTNHLYVIDLHTVLERSAEDVDWRSRGRISMASAESDSINGGCGGSSAAR